MSKPYYGDGPWLNSPVGSFPKNQTPSGIYDLMSYHGAYGGQWCSDLYVEEESGTGQREALRVVRGAYRKRTNLTHVWPKRSRFERFMNLLGETTIPRDHEGRSWNRNRMYERSRFALVRLVTDARSSSGGD